MGDTTEINPINYGTNSSDVFIFAQGSPTNDAAHDHLSVLRREGVIVHWWDREISAGKEWKGIIDEHLETAQIILFLVSPSFLASDYCYDVEVKRAMER